jgi:hypothetical protein
MAGQFGLRFRLPRKSQGSFTCRKSATWEGRHAVDFFARKIRRLRASSNPRSWVLEASMITTRPPKPLVDGGTTVSSESVCQVARSCVDVGSFYTRLFGVVCVTCDDFHDWSEKWNSECASKFVPILGKVLRRPSQSFKKPSGTK